MVLGLSKRKAAAKSKAFKADYPMYVIPVRELAKMTGLLPHDELLKRGFLRKWTEDMRVICVSHQWLSHTEPDPEGEHFNCLKRLLERFMEGKLSSMEHGGHLLAPQGLHKVTKTGGKTFDWSAVSEMYVWIDYCSMPQVGPHCGPTEVRNAAKAVQSIPAYFERCSLLLVIAPVCKHRDTGSLCSYASWRRRGWCRMELTCSILTPEGAPVVVCTGPEARPFQLHPFDGPRLLPGQGEFSCCALQHSMNGVRIACDRSKVGTALNHMITTRAQQLLEEGRRLDHHFWMSLRETIVGSLDGSPPPLADSISLVDRIPTLLGADIQLEIAEGKRAQQLLVAPREEEHQFHPQQQQQPREEEHQFHPQQQQQEQQQEEQQQDQQQQPPPPKDQVSLAAFKEKLGWTAVDDAAAAKTGFSLVLCAALGNEARVIRELAAQGGTNFNQRMKMMTTMHLAYMIPGVTPLMAAMVFAEFSTVEALLEARANPDKTVAGITPLHVASCRGNNDTVIGWLKRFPSKTVDPSDAFLGLSPCVFNCANGVNKLEILQHLVVAGANVHMAPRWGGSATMLCLMAVSEDPDLGAAKMLLELKCDPNERWKPTRCVWKNFFKAMRNTPAPKDTRWLDEFAMMAGATPLHFAAKRGDVALSQLLVSAGGRVDIKNFQGHTPIEVAKQFFVEVPPLLEEALVSPIATGSQD